MLESVSYIGDILSFYLDYQTNESFLARPYLVLKHMDKQTFDPVGGNAEERKPLNLALLHKVKKCYDTRIKNYYDCVARLPLKVTPRRRRIKKKGYVNYIKSEDTKHLLPYSFKHWFYF